MKGVFVKDDYLLISLFCLVKPNDYFCKANSLPYFDYSHIAFCENLKMMANYES
jgi:hypothetical protein